jgi:hypothetical protein
MEIRIQKRKKEFKDSKTKLPRPSKVKQILSDEKIKKITAPQLAKLLGKSRDTICRMADRGEIPCFDVLSQLKQGEDVK